MLRFNDEVLVGLHVPARVGLKVLLSYQVEGLYVSNTLLNFQHHQGIVELKNDSIGHRLTRFEDNCV